MPNPTLTLGDAVIYTDAALVERDAVCILANGNTGNFLFAKDEESTKAAYYARCARINQSGTPTANSWVWPA